MRHTVIGLFNTYAEADGARRTLVEAGFAYNDVELRANPETASDAAADESPGVLANIERFFSSLFASSGPSETDAAHYSDAIRSGAVLLSVDVANPTRAEIAHNTLTQLGALDVSERTRDDRLVAGADTQARREHSMLDELGIGGAAAVPTAAQPLREPLRAAEDERRWERVDAPPHDTPIDDDPARTAIAAGSAPGSGAVLRPDLADQAQDSGREYGAAGVGQHERSHNTPADELARRQAMAQSDAEVADGGAAPITGGTDDYLRAARDASAASAALARDNMDTAHGYQQPAPAIRPDESMEFPSTTVRGAAQYQSDPPDIGRAADSSAFSQEQRGQWPGQSQGQGQWPGQSQRQSMSRPGSTGAYAAREDEPYPPVAPSTSRRVPAADADRDTESTSSFAAERAAHMPDEHQPPQTFAPDGDDTRQSAKTPGGNAYASDDAGRKSQQSPSYAPNVGATASSESPVGAGMMNELDARRAMGAQADPPADTGSLETTRGNLSAAASTAPAARDNEARVLRDAPLLDDTVPSATSRANENPTSATRAQQIPDEFLEYEEDFHTHYDAQFGRAADARYDEYVPAYRYGATIGRDSRYQDRPWDDDVELEARHDWERAEPEGSWDRFKAAVRHGWERVTGHPPHH
ncbi:hypothetical protein GCM10027093_35060 [Paraburkholderia jirisanensis]